MNTALGKISVSIFARLLGGLQHIEFKGGAVGIGKKDWHKETKVKPYYLGGCL